MHTPADHKQHMTYLHKQWHTDRRSRSHFWSAWPTYVINDVLLGYPADTLGIVAHGVRGFCGAPALDGIPDELDSRQEGRGHEECNEGDVRSEDAGSVFAMNGEQTVLRQDVQVEFRRLASRPGRK